MTPNDSFLKTARVRWILIVAAMLFATSAHAAGGAIKVHGAPVDDEAKKVGDSRYKSSEDWEKTVRFYRNMLGNKAGIVWSTVDTPPRVKAIHIANTLSKRTWEGINIYEVNGDIFIYVIAATAETKAEKKG